VDGVGTPIGPRLGHAVHSQSEAELVRWLRDPSACKEHPRMPRIALTGTEIQALAAWLVSLE
jgi:cytochrome c1